jgi:hypothetical protein
MKERPVKWAFVARVTDGSPFAFSQSDNHRRNRTAAGDGVASVALGYNNGWGKENAGTDLSGWNEGVGEHVRTKIPPDRRSPVKLRTSSDPHRTKKTCFFCQIGFPKKFDPAV